MIEREEEEEEEEKAEENMTRPRFLVDELFSRRLHTSSFCCVSSHMASYAFQPDLLVAEQKS